MSNGATMGSGGGGVKHRYKTKAPVGNSGGAGRAGKGTGKNHSPV